MEYLQGDKRQQLLLKANGSDGIRLAWQSPGTLQICYGPTHIYRFNNHFDYAERESLTLYRVEVVLKRAATLHDC